MTGKKFLRKRVSRPRDKVEGSMLRGLNTSITEENIMGDGGERDAKS